MVYEFIPKMTWAAAATIVGFILTGTVTFTMVRADVRDLQSKYQSMDEDGSKYLRRQTDVAAKEFTDLKVKNAEIAAEVRAIREMIERIDKRIEKTYGKN